MEYLFVRNDKGHWQLKITTQEQLEDYIKKSHYLFSDALSDVFHSSDFKYGDNHCSGLGHTIGSYSIREGVTPYEAAEYFDLARYESMKRVLEKSGCLLINRKGGYCISKQDEKFKQFVRRKYFNFPKYERTDIRIKRYNDFSDHYYVYVGDLEVKNEDGTPFKTEDYNEAYAKAQEFLKG